MYRKKSRGWMKHIDFIVLDMLCLILAFLGAYMTRNHGSLPFGDEAYVSLSVILLLTDFATLIATDAMKSVLRRGYYQEFAKTVKHVALVAVLAVLYLFAIKRSQTYSRLFLVCFGLYYSCLSYLLRLWWKRVIRGLDNRSKSALYIISTGDRICDVVQRYQGMESADYQITGICLLDADRTGESVLGVPVTSTADSVLSFLCREWVDEVVISIPKEHAYPTELLDSLTQMGIVVHLEMETLSDMPWQQRVESIGGKTVITMSMNMATPTQLFLKRSLDIVGGIVGCALTAVLTLIIGPLIYIQSPGSIFFSQTRIGKNGKPFQMYKFRSMYLDAEARKAELMAQNRVGSGLMFKLDYDPRIIGSKKLPDGTVKKGIGNYIRDWSLDEFPQFWNVLKGDLSLVGTRPPTLDEWEKYEPHHRARMASKPGITGMWQVSGRSKITDFERVVALDKKYIQEWSMGLDIKILLQTILVVLRREGSM